MATTQAQLDSLTGAGYQVLVSDGTTVYNVGLLKEDNEFSLTLEEELEDIKASQTGMANLKTISKGANVADFDLEIWAKDKYVMSNLLDLTELDATSSSNTEAGVVVLTSKIEPKKEFSLAIYPVNQASGTLLTVADTNPRAFLFYKVNIINPEIPLVPGISPYKITVKPLGNLNGSAIDLYQYGAGVDPTDLSWTDPTP